MAKLYREMKTLMAEIQIKKADEMDDAIGAFINTGFARYGEQNGVALRYEEFCFVARDRDPVYSLFQTPLEMREYLLGVQDKSTFEAKKKYDLSTVNRIIVLSTCTNDVNDARYIVIGVPIPIE